MSTSAGRCPEERRALELLKSGADLFSVCHLLNVASATVKKWAKRAGVTIPPASAEQRAANIARLDRIAAGRKRYEMKVTESLPKSFKR